MTPFFKRLWVGMTETFFCNKNPWHSGVTRLKARRFGIIYRGGDFLDRGGGRPWLPGGADKMANLEHPPEAKFSGDVSHALRVRRYCTADIIHIVLLLVLTLRVSLPQSETIWTAYDTPADLVRLILGVGVCAWLVYQLFQVPHDAGTPAPGFILGSLRCRLP
jgi:hypothetical protein